MAVHDHCCSCMKVSCAFQEGCAVVSCPGCDVSMHECKLLEHVALICPETTIACILAQFGCPDKVKRKDLLAHMEKCAYGGARSDVHAHCKYCLVPNSSCKTPKGTCCALEPCPKCALPIHPCQQAAHEEKLCSQAFVKCVNAVNGCKAFVKRSLMPIHLQHCPASVVQCNFGYYRYWRKRFTTPKRDLAETPLPDEDFQSADEHLTAGKRHRGFLSLYPSSRIALLTDIRRFTLEGNKVALTGGKFICGRFLRRDEWVDHVANHQDLGANLEMKIRRCPLWNYGCNYGVFSHQPMPAGFQLRYNMEIGSFMVHKPLLVDSARGNTDEVRQRDDVSWEGEEAVHLDLLGHLPLELLLKVLSYLDSISLWCLSQVNHYLRETCQMCLQEQGLVYNQWDCLEGNYRRWRIGKEVSDRELRCGTCAVHCLCGLDNLHGLIVFVLCQTLPQYQALHSCYSPWPQARKSDRERIILLKKARYRNI